MRLAVLAVILLFALSPFAGCPPAVDGSGVQEVSVRSPPPPDEAPAASTSEFLLEPGDGMWLPFSPSVLRIRFLNATLGLQTDQSTLRLDGESRTFTWNPSTRVLESLILDELDDGIHNVEASLTHEDASRTDLAWSFWLDTQVPVVQVEPLPAVTANQTLEVRGRATDISLVGVTVGGHDASLDNGNFSVVVRLWPALNDILVEARDRAGNLGRVVVTVELETPVFEGAMEHLVVENGSFAIDLPQGWIAQENVRLPSGNRADLIAVAPLPPELETSLIVAAERTNRVFPESLALEWMDLVLAGVAGSGQLKQVVSQPRILEDPQGTVAVRSTFLRQVAISQVAFVQLTMVWSQPLRTQWVLLAATEERTAALTWPPLEAAVASFRVLDEGIGGPGDTGASYLLPTALVLSAIAALILIAAVALLPTYLAVRRERQAGRWRPPRNWGRL